MVVTAKFISVYNPSGLTEYYLRETQPQHERDLDREYMQLPDPGEYAGTVPHLRQDISERAAQALALTPNQTPSLEEVYNVISGARADGMPTGRQTKPNYERADGQQFKPLHLVDVTVTPDKTISLAIANAETQGGRAMVLSAAHNAADDSVRDIAEHIGYARLGRSGNGGLEKGDLGWIRFTHHTTRPAQDGTVMPNLHMHYVIPNALAMEDGKVRSLTAKRLIGNIEEFS
jgi:hypothetical protein